MKNLRIATWNIKNSYFALKKNELKAKAVVQLLRSENLDILALQEVNPLLAIKIEENLRKIEMTSSNTTYQVTSTYQRTNNPIKNLRVEYNMIISKMNPILDSTTESLSSSPKGIKKFKFWERRNRNMITQVFENNLAIDVTHLDHTSEELGKRQMTEVANFVHNQVEEGYNVILTGNLNRKPMEQNMIDFTSELSNSDMKVVENLHKTYIGHQEEQPVDYVIVPNDWQIDSVKTLEEYDEYSSHRPVVVETRKR